MERNQIFDSLASVGRTVAGLVATLLEGKKSDLLGPTGASSADGAFSSTVPKDGGKSDPILGVRLGAFKLVGHLDARNSRPPHGRKPDTTYAAITAAPLAGGFELRLIEAGSPGLHAWPGANGSQDLTERLGSWRAKRMRNGF